MASHIAQQGSATFSMPTSGVAFRNHQFTASELSPRSRRQQNFSPNFNLATHKILHVARAEARAFVKFIHHLVSMAHNTQKRVARVSPKKRLLRLKSRAVFSFKKKNKKKETASTATVGKVFITAVLWQRRNHFRQVRWLC